VISEPLRTVLQFTVLDGHQNINISQISFTSKAIKTCEEKEKLSWIFIEGIKLNTFHVFLMDINKFKTIVCYKKRGVRVII